MITDDTLNTCNSKSAPASSSGSAPRDNNPLHGDLSRCGDLNRYNIVTRVGNGAFSTVWKAIDSQTGSVVAIKSCKRASSGEIPLSVRNEIEVLAKLNHPHIVGYRDVIVTGNTIYIVMEFVNGSTLADVIRNRKLTRERDIFHLFHQLISALYELHRHHICHRDIKPENIIVTAGGQLTLVDFGFSKQLSQDCMSSTPCGSLYSSAPEVNEHTLSFDCLKADMWSVGTVLYAMYQSQLPFADSVNAHHVRIQKQFATVRFPKFTPKEAESLIRALMDRDIESRLSCAGVLEHPYWTKNCQRFKLPRLVDKDHTYPMRSTDRGKLRFFRRWLRLLPVCNGVEVEK